jgi:predicted Zn-dependent peptidase
MHHDRPCDETCIDTLANGVRVLTIDMPQLETACVSVYVRAGSAHESRVGNGISHVVEHMAFKGTVTRDAQRINYDAECLGADVNAHTDKDHTAYHMRGLARDAEAFVRMLGDIVRQPTFPRDELESERQVLLQEFAEDDDDPMVTAFKLFDRACYGLHPVAQPVIGTRANLERFTREDLLDHVHRLYSGSNIIVAAAGRVDAAAIARAAEQAFAGLPCGTPNRVASPPYVGDVRTRAMAGTRQTHVVLGFPLAPAGADDVAGAVAAAVLGEGMSSPLMQELREKRGLAYYAACSADVFETHGQFVIEASMAPERLDELVEQCTRLLLAQAQAVSLQDLDRARNQLRVRRLRMLEKPACRLEQAALDLFALGRVRDHASWLGRIDALGAEAVRGCFESLLNQRASLAVTGRLARGVRQHLRERLPQPRQR